MCAYNMYSSTCQSPHRFGGNLTPEPKQSIQLLRTQEVHSSKGGEGRLKETAFLYKIVLITKNRSTSSQPEWSVVLFSYVTVVKWTLENVKVFVFGKCNYVTVAVRPTLIVHRCF
jgi:hypothetical protein